MTTATTNGKRRYTRGALCEYEGCDKPHRARGLCYKHWARWRRNGDPSILLIGQEPANPKPCIICGASIPTPEHNKPAPVTCGQVCQSRHWYIRHRMSTFRERLAAGLLRRI